MSQNENKNTNVPEPVVPDPAKPITAEVELPVGMDKVEFMKQMATFTKQRDYTAKRDKASREALKILKTAHLDEYNIAFEAELAKVNLTK